MPQNLLGKKIKSFNMLKVLGQGAFATVFQAVNDKDSAIVAVKVINMKELNRSKKLRQLVQTQITVLKQCKNENVIAYIDSFETSQFLFIVTEFCNGGDLEQLIARKKIPEDEAVAFLHQILNGFKGLHEVGAMHRDFKAANVLLNDGVCKIADLGFSKQMEETSIAKTILGTSLTMAPQVLEETPYTFSADIWSIGVVFYQMIYGDYPYNGPNDFVLLKNIKTKRPSYEGINISKHAKDFIQKCLALNPRLRISWKQIYQHPLIQQRQRKSLTPGILKSKISINKNMKFYENAEMLSEQASDKLIESAKRITLEILPDEQLIESAKIEDALKQAQAIKQREEIADRFDNLYIGRRNDLMFFSKFIQPYIPSFSHLRINHPIACFLLSKKSYLELQKLHTSLAAKKPVFYSQQNFQVYQQMQNYQKVQAQVQDDVETVRQYCEQERGKINGKLNTKEIKGELLRLDKAESQNFEGLVEGIIADYVRLLVERLGDVEGQTKINMVRVIEALNYCRGNSKPYSYEFDRIISTINFKEAEAALRKKYGYF